ncbi:molybdenum cofactor biosynthesis protein B [Colwelliaceae bacterium 6441]
MSSSQSTHGGNDFISLNIAVLTVSDTRDESNDTSGQLLEERVTSAGHQVAEKAIVKDDVYQLRAIVSKWIADENIQAVISTGGTGFTLRDNTPEALLPLFDKSVEGFGEVFRAISLDEIGTSTIQSRAFGGIANQTVILCVPGSTNACRTAWDKLIKEQLDASHRPCNFVPHLNIKNTKQCETRN